MTLLVLSTCPDKGPASTGTRGKKPLPDTSLSAGARKKREGGRSKKPAPFGLVVCWQLKRERRKADSASPKPKTAKPREGGKNLKS